jgi:hypothetical protein
MIWDNVYNFVCENLGKPVVCFGDLNDIMCDMDTTSINVNKFRMRTFNSYVKQCGLFDLGYSGPAYTWTNKRFASNPIFERLDRCLANAEWCTLFPNTNVLTYQSSLVTTHLFLYPLNLNTKGRDYISNLKIGGLMKKIFSVLPKMLGLLQLVGLFMLEQLILQVL